MFISSFKVADDDLPSSLVPKQSHVSETFRLSHATETSRKQALHAPIVTVCHEQVLYPAVARAVYHGQAIQNAAAAFVNPLGTPSPPSPLPQQQPSSPSPTGTCLEAQSGVIV